MTFRENWKINHFLTARKMCDMYYKGEEEIMGNSITATVSWPSTISLVSTGIKMTPVIPLDCCNEQEGTTPMNEIKNTERDYLNRRLRDTKCSLHNELQKQFHIYDSTSPCTYKELIDWVKNGKYELDSQETKRVDDFEGEWHGDCFYGIKWTGRGFTNDYEGFNVADRALEKAFLNAQDVINTSYPEAGLKALKEFEAWTFTTEAPAKSKKH